MTWYDVVKCQLCGAETTALVSSSSFGGAPSMRDPFASSGFVRCSECSKVYCQVHAPTDEVCDLCVNGTDQPLATPAGVTFTLDMTADECQALANVLVKIGGYANKSQRRFTDAVYSRLMSLGFVSQGGNVTSGAIYFEIDRHLKNVRKPGQRS